ncbi:MAG TPA: hypothetical protein VHT75_07795 [Acidimicrobiales bacterium]|nr:hypothetical protein [Acidimicrobiales bacterium]
MSGRTLDFTNSIRYAVSHAVTVQAASANDSSGGLGNTFLSGTAAVLRQRALVLLGQPRPSAVEVLVPILPRAEMTG